MWLITHLPPLFNFFIFMLDEKEEKEESQRLEADESQGGGSGLGGIHCCCRPLYLNNCTSWFMGFREVLCVSFAAALGICGTSFPHDQYSERFTSGAKTCYAWIWIYIFLYFLFLFDFSFVLSFLYPSAFSYQHVVQLFFDKVVPSITHAYLYRLT